MDIYYTVNVFLKSKGIETSVSGQDFGTENKFTFLP